MTNLEKAAFALEGFGVDAFDAERMVHAVLTAIREPDESMLAAMRAPSMAFDNEAPGVIYSDEHRRADIVELWNEGVDSILAEKPHA